MSCWRVARLRSADGMIPLAQLTEAFHTGDGGDAAVAYAESYVGARVLVERLGPNLPVFLQHLSNGTAIDQALGDIDRTRAAREERGAFGRLGLPGSNHQRGECIGT